MRATHKAKLVTLVSTVTALASVGGCVKTW
jgi:hypothetical protein